MNSWLNAEKHDVFWVKTVNVCSSPAKSLKFKAIESEELVDGGKRDEARRCPSSTITTTTQNKRVWVAAAAAACVCWFVLAPPVFVVVSCSLGVFLSFFFFFAYVGREDRREGNDQESWTKTETAAIKLAS